MEKKLFYTILLSITISSLLSQTTFIRAYSYNPLPNYFGYSTVYGVAEMSGGEYFMAMDGGLLVKTGPTGKPLLVKLLMQGGNAVNYFIPYFIGAAGNNEYYLAGRKGSSDSVFVARINASGDLIWQKGFVSKDLSYQCALKTNDAGILLCMSRQNSNGKDEPVVAKFDMNGTIQWQKQFLNPSGTSGHLRFYDITELGNGELVYGGRTNHLPSYSGPVIMKTNSTGTVLLAKTLNTYTLGAAIMKVKAMSNGNIRVVLNYPEAGSQFGYFDIDNAAVVSSQGNKYSGLANSVQSYCINSAGEILGSVVNTSNAFKIAANGSVAFANNYFANVFPTLYPAFESALFTSDGGYLFPGYYSVNLFNGSTGLMVKTASNGNSITGFYVPFTFQQAAYTNTTVPLTVKDSSVSHAIPTFLTSSPLTLFYDTLYGVTAGIKEYAGTPFSIYPNPAKEEITITVPGALSESYAIRISDMIGREKYSGSFNGETFRIPGADLNDGVHFVEIKSLFNGNEKKYITQKLVIRR